MSVKKDNPYVGLPEKAYWGTAISNISPLAINSIFEPKFQITLDMPIVAAGSCFAQHIGRQFKAREFNFMDLEPAPPLLIQPNWIDYGFDMYSARYGNVYSIRQLVQLAKRAFGRFEPIECVWENKGRYYDPFRPSIEKDGFTSESELLQDRKFHLKCVKELILKCEVFVFTFGLTEAWIDKRDGAVFPSCPGTVAGEFNEEICEFHNFSYSEVLDDAMEFINFTKSINPDIKFLFTVSPVPLTATASTQHVLSASTYSKSVLRAVCGELVGKLDYVDYFPSYELISSHPFRGMFYNPNLRTVASGGVEHVMKLFFDAYPVSTSQKEERVKEIDINHDDVACEEEILEAYAK